MTQRAASRLTTSPPYLLSCAWYALIRNDFDTAQVLGQFAHPLARRVGVGALGRLLKGGADVSDGLETEHAPGTPHAVPQKFHSLKVTPIQSVQHHDDILP